jgi:hypothetical protein
MSRSVYGSALSVGADVHLNAPIVSISATICMTVSLPS